MVWLWIWLSTLFVPVSTASAVAAPVAPADSIVFFLHTEEPREHAFSYLLPSRWNSVGGVVRRDPLAPSPNPQVVAPQLDFTVERDSTGGAMIHWLPNVVYCDIARAHVSGSEIFPVGSTYQGMLVYPQMSAENFLTKLMIGCVHPAASNVKVLDQKRLPSLSREYANLLRAAPGQLTFHFDAASLTLSYDERGVTFKERWLTVIEDWGEMGGGQWGNKETVYFRAPIAEFDSLLPLFEVIYGSMVANPTWVAAELPLDSARKDIGLNTRHNAYDLSRRRTLHQQQISNAIRSALFGESTGIARYLNPFSGLEELSPAAWHFRWVDQTSNVLFSNDSLYAPESDSRFDAFHFRRCEAALDSLRPSHPLPTSLGQN